MGYFSNGSEADDYQEKYCMKCLNWKERNDEYNGDGCPIWDAHLMGNYTFCNHDDSPLDVLIPRQDAGWNKECRMFEREKPSHESE